MIRIALSLVLASAVTAAVAAPSSSLPPLPPLPPSLDSPIVLNASDSRKPATASYTLDKMTVVDFVKMYYTEIAKSSFVLDPKAVQSDAVISVSLSSMPVARQREVFEQVLAASGFVIEQRAGVDFIRMKGDQDKPLADQVFIYRPKYRDGQYLTDLVSSLFSTGRFTQNRRGTIQTDTRAEAPNDTGGSALAYQSTRPTDVLVFNGTAAEVAKLKGYLSQLDRPVPKVHVRALVYEVSQAANSGFDLAAFLHSASNSVSVGFGNTSIGGNGGGEVSLKLPLLDAVAQIFETDSRFKVITSPDVLADDGQRTRFQNGQDVPIPQVSYDSHGNPIQTVVYKSAGVILDVKPTIRGDSVELSINNEISSFVVNKALSQTAPTMLTRNMVTTFSAKSGQVYIIGGQRGSKYTRDQTRLPVLGWTISHAQDDEGSQIVMVVQADIEEQTN